MAITAKRLADGTVPDGKAALYTVPENTITYIKSIIIHANQAATVILYAKKSGGTSRCIFYRELEEHTTAYFNEPIILQAGDSIEGNAPNKGLQVDYWISGGEET